MNYTESIEYIHSVSWKGSRPGLERIRELCEMLGNPQDDLRFIHVAGTNGKGSFCAVLERILREAGYTAGMFTSPYIENFEERMQVSGKPITPEELAEITSYVRPFADSMADKPTEFELITAIGFEYFRRKGCSVVILEAGMGGRLDSTNIIKSPLLCVITGISLDHTEYLGNTITEIAREKAGIIKAGSMVLYGGEAGEASDIILQRANELICPCYAVDNSLLSNVRLSIDGTTFDYGRYENLKLNLLGDYQLYNAARAITACEILRAGGVKITDEAVRSGLEKATWKGRFERFSREPDVFFDGAHNPEGIGHAAKSIRGYYPDQKIVLVTGVMQDKDFSSMADTLAPLCQRVFTVRPDNPRALLAEEYATVYAENGVYATAYKSFDAAVKEAYAYAKKENLPLFCLGSLYSYTSFKKAIQPLIEK